MAKGISLHIGLNEVDPNHYVGWKGELNACEADAEDMNDIAKSQGFKSTLLLTKQATRDTVIKSIKNAANALGKGDIFFISYAGHGGQVPDRNRDEADYQDETWCLYDGQLIDDELYEFWALFQQGVRILVISDSCHSGTVTRDPVGFDFSSITRGPAAEELGIVDAKARFMPAANAAKTYRANKTFYDQIQVHLPKKRSKIAARVRLISGCQDNQRSLDGTFNGLFTGQLLKVWNSGRFKGNYSDFHSSILKMMPGSQSPNHFIIGTQNLKYDEQKPFTI